MGQCEDLADVQARRDDEVTRAFWRSLDEERRFDLDEVVLVHVGVDDLVHAMAELEDALHARPCQVEISVLEPDALIGRRVIFYRKRRSPRASEHRERRCLALDLT